MPALTTDSSDLVHSTSTASKGALPRWLQRVLATTPDTAPLIARLTLGIVMFPHGAQKMLGWFGGHGFDATLSAFSGKLGIPVVFGVLAIVAEFFGSIGLVLGAISRVAAFGIAVVMLVVILMLHAHVGFFMNWTGAQAGEGFEYHLLATGLALIVMVKGAGAYSIDHWLATRKAR
jgi:putative oxidoreductase